MSWIPGTQRTTAHVIPGCLHIRRQELSADSVHSLGSLGASYKVGLDEELGDWAGGAGGGARTCQKIEHAAA